MDSQHREQCKLQRWQVISFVYSTQTEADAKILILERKKTVEPIMSPLKVKIPNLFPILIDDLLFCGKNILSEKLIARKREAHIFLSIFFPYPVFDCPWTVNRAKEMSTVFVANWRLKPVRYFKLDS